MLTLHKLRRFCCVNRLQGAWELYENDSRFLNPLNFAGSVTFTSNVGNPRCPRNTPPCYELTTLMHFNAMTVRLCTNAVTRKCWSCGTTAPSFFCPSCKLVQPSEAGASYFAIMDCAESFALDTQRLQRTYLQLQRALHPDNFSQRTPKEQEYSADQSALVNKAYRTLLKPLSRGLYMLELKGMHLEEGTDMAADPQLLMEVMEINESLAETQSPDEVDAIGHSMRERLKDLTVEINSTLNKGDLQSAKALLAQMKYFANIEEKVKEKLSELAERT